MSGAERIAAERQRQIAHHGFTAEADDEVDSDNPFLARMGAAYLLVAIASLSGDHDDHALYSVGRKLGEQNSDFKPNGTAIRHLEKAGALIAAEIDRLTRAEE